jgi:hypothetical protein
MMLEFLAICQEKSLIFCFTNLSKRYLLFVFDTSNNLGT